MPCFIHVKRLSYIKTIHMSNLSPVEYLYKMILKNHDVEADAVFNKNKTVHLFLLYIDIFIIILFLFTL